MRQKFKGWAEVAELLRKIINDRAVKINDGQASSLRAAADRLPNNGIIIADEVGMGKTRIAAVVAKAVIAAGGRVAILAPPGLGDQWKDELRKVEVDSPAILRSLDTYLNAWNGSEKKWADKNLILLSHMFCNWSLKSNTKKNWKWALLPAVLKIQEERNRESKRVRVGVNSNKFDDPRIDAAAKWISDNGSSRYLNQLTKNTEINLWGKYSPLFVPANYTKDTEFREGLECVVGIGLGIFDLVIIDEAHKNRGEESNLNRLLNQVVLMSNNSRCLAMTATPVELDANQWTQILERIRIDERSKLMANDAIVSFAEAVAKVRQSLSDANVREKYKGAAKCFKERLNPYVLRRDKREDESVIKFKECSGESYHSYRREHEIIIDTAHLSEEWKQAVSAAEALSFVSRQFDNPTAKRLRLTLGNGHGVAALIDQVHLDENDDGQQILLDNEAVILKSNCNEHDESSTKRKQREEWWKSVLIKPFAKKDGSVLFSHPAILAAAEEIERICDKNEKVLVFGKLTRPLKALVQLLNAREMLKCIDTNRLWPQSKVAESDWPAIVVAHQQLKRQGKLNRGSLNSQLKDQYGKLENLRHQIRDKLLENIESGFDKIDPEKGVHARMLFKAFQQSIEINSGINQTDKYHSLAWVSRAIHELIGDDIEKASTVDYALAFIDFVTTISDPDEEDKDSVAQFDEHIGSNQWNVLTGRLKEEYNRSEGGFARLMYSETKPETRRLLQLAFNRKHGHPKVLVAQSLVGREGLNLHKACRTVVLLHPEWNPGVVEQQIGRVDRLGSLWSEKLNQAVKDGLTSNGLPRIEIRPVVFKGTYDEKNWEVLQARWDDLRSQLHGVVISPRIAKNYPHLHELIDEINNAAPNFSPSD